MSKSYVTLEQKRCLICDKAFDTGSLLLDKRLQERFEMHTVTGLGICPTCDKVGYIALIECEPEKSTEGSIWRTGGIVHVKKEAWGKIFNTDAPKCGFAFVGPDTIQRLKVLMEGGQQCSE